MNIAFETGSKKLRSHCGPACLAVPRHCFFFFLYKFFSVTVTIVLKSTKTKSFRWWSCMKHWLKTCCCNRFDRTRKTDGKLFQPKREFFNPSFDVVSTHFATMGVKRLETTQTMEDPLRSRRLAARQSCWLDAWFTPPRYESSLEWPQPLHEGCGHPSIPC